MTRLDTAAPVAGAKVTIVTLDGKAVWTGTTGADGVAIAPQTRLRDPRDWSEFAFIVTAEKDGDVAYVGSDWNEGVAAVGVRHRTSISTKPIRCCAARCSPIAASTSSAKRSTSRRCCAATRPAASGCCPTARGVSISVTDSRNKVVDERIVKVNAWSTAEWTLTVPAEGSLGNYVVRAMLESDRTEGRRRRRPGRGARRA